MNQGIIKYQLADVEVQMIMHGLDVLDILRFSRCNKFLRHASADSFAWKHAPELLISANDMIKIAIRVKQFCNLLCTDKSSPLQHIKLFLKCREDESWSQQGLKMLLEAITAFPICIKRITCIDFSECHIGDFSCLFLAKIIKLLDNIRILKIAKNYIRFHSIGLLVDALKNNPNISLIDLSLDNIGMGNKGAKLLSKLIRHCPGLKDLNLNMAGIGDEGAISLASAVNFSTSLTSLNLESNVIENSGLEALSDAIKKSSSITSIFLQDNDFDDDGVIVLSDAIKHNKSLTSISVGNYIKESGLIALASAIEHNETLTSVNIIDNPMHGSSISILSKAIKNNKSLMCLGLIRCNLYDHDIIIFADLVKHSKNIRHLDVSGNYIESVSMKALLDTFLYNKNQTSVSFKYNQKLLINKSLLMAMLKHGKISAQTEKEEDTLIVVQDSAIERVPYHKNKRTTQ